MIQSIPNGQNQVPPYIFFPSPFHSVTIRKKGLLQFTFHAYLKLH